MEEYSETRANRSITLEATASDRWLGRPPVGILRQCSASARTRMLVDTEVLTLVAVGALDYSESISAPVTLKQLFTGLLENWPAARKEALAGSIIQ